MWELLISFVQASPILLLLALWERLRATRVLRAADATAKEAGFRMETQRGFFGSIWLKLTGISPRMEITGAPAAARIDIGDPDFPDVTGDPVVVLSALCGAARATFRSLARYDVHVRGGAIICVTTALSSTERIREIQAAMLKLAEEMTRDGPGPASLRENALRDPLVAVRSRNAELLVSRFEGAPEMNEVLAAVRDRTVELEPHWPITAKVLEPDAILEDTQTPEIVSAFRVRRAAAIRGPLFRALAHRGKRAESILMAVVAASPDDEVALAALAVIGGVASVEVVEGLRRLKTFASGPAFERTIELIKARAEGAQPGQISLTDDARTGGQLAVATQPGSLSRPERTR